MVKEKCLPSAYKLIQFSPVGFGSKYKRGSEVLMSLKYENGVLLVKVLDSLHLNVSRGKLYARSALLEDKEKSEEETRGQPGLGRSKQKTEEVEAHDHPTFKNPLMVCW